MKGRDGFNLRYLRRNEITALARRICVADTADIDRFLIAWFWHRPPSADLDQVGAVMETARRMGKSDLGKTDAEGKNVRNNFYILADESVRERQQARSPSHRAGTGREQ